MLAVRLQLPTESVVGLLIWVLAIPPAGLAIALAAGPYQSFPGLQVSASLMCAFLFLSTIANILQSVLPQYFLLRLLTATSIFPLMGSGIYWLARRIQDIPVAGADPFPAAKEVPCLVLWLCYLVANSAFATYSLMVEPEHHLELPPTPTMSELSEYIGPRSQPSSNGTSPLTENFNTNLFQSTPFLVADPHHEPVASRPQLRLKRAQSSFNRVFNVHHTSRRIPRKRDATSMPNLSRMPSLTGLEAVPEGFNSNFEDWELSEEANALSRVPWVLMHTDVLQNRSVSGSSQESDLGFPATNYNRKINEAGFQKHEPVPMSKARLRSNLSFSQYDRERLRLSLV